MSYQPSNVEVNAKTHAKDMDRLLNLECALLLAQELGQCYRGDWTDFDGSTLRNQMNALSKVADGTVSIATYRSMNCMCPAGQGHWSENCGPYDCPGALPALEDR